MQQVPNKHFLKLLKQNKRLTERVKTHTERTDKERASLKRKVDTEEAYDEGVTLAVETTDVPVAKPMSLLLYEMKRGDDERLVYSDLISRGRHQLTNKRHKAYSAQEAEAYLAKQPQCTLLDWQESAICAIEDRERDKAGIGSRGLMLCLDMGLGKTVITLVYLQYDNQRCFRQTGSRYNGCTLIAVPGKLLIDEGWLYEVRTKWPANSFDYHVLHSSKNRQVSRLYIENCCDFMIVTYSTIEAAYRYHQNGGALRDSDEPADAQQYKYELLYLTKWKRIVADESHYFVNEETQRSKAMNALQSEINWAVTGTPIQNRLRDICANFRFIRIPQSQQILLNREDVDVSDEEKQHIKKTLDIVMLRKLKSELNTHDKSMLMMPIVKTIRLIEFESLQERVVYYLYATYGSRSHASNNVASILQLMMQLCIGMRIVKDLVLPRGLLTLGNNAQLKLKQCAHSESLFPQPDELQQQQETEDDTLEAYAARLGARTEFAYNTTSKNTLLNLPDGYQMSYHPRLREQETPATEACIQESFAWDPYREDAQFDLRGSEEDRTAYQEVYQSLCDNVESARDLIKKGSAKRRAMVKHLMSRTLREPHYSSKNRHVIKYIQQEVPADDKVIVFCNLIGALEWLAYDLAAHGIDVIMVNGTTSDNNERIRRFKEGPVRVLLLSFKLGNVGLNLTQANHVLYLHPWWNPNMTEQSENRVHRLGQYKVVYIVHFIVNHTIDMYVINLSHDKKRMTSSMIGCKDKKEEKKLEIERYVYSLYKYTMSQ